MRAVVTGGAGFLGSHLCDRLIEMGFEVLCMDNLSTGSTDNIAHLLGNSRFKFVKHNVVDYLYVDGPVDAVLHFASPASPIDYLEMPIQTLKVGSLGSHKSLGLAREKKARYLLASTSEIYGDPLVNPQPETYWGNVNPIGPRGVYDEAKRFAEAMAMAYRRYHSMDVRIVRIFNTYGPRMRPNDGRVVSNFIVQALQRKPLTIYGDGSQTRSFCFVSDLISGILALLSLPPSEEAATPFNIGNPEERTVRDLASKVLALTGSSSPIETRDLPVDDPHVRCPDITRAKKILGWQPRVGIDEGLGLTIEYFKKMGQVQDNASRVLS
ncbi:MAG TPA: UDP-glucuronic acid decarboxylase family protein [Terriglobia bacterium]|nr:UDP-glucuronic acid decarboxylase family protein [Terriglobia bacterium]